MLVVIGAAAVRDNPAVEIIAGVVTLVVAATVSAVMVVDATLSISPVSATTFTAVNVPSKTSLVMISVS